MEPLILTRKYIKELLSNKTKKYLKTSKDTPCIEGNLQFTFSKLNDDLIIKICLLNKDNGELILSVKRSIVMNPEDTFTFGPVCTQIDLN